MPERIIAHLDMDAFFASVEEREKPYLKDKPLVIGADPKGGKGRGVVSTASYAARSYGIGSAMPIQKAWQLCEKGRKEGGEPCVFITGGFSKYGRASKEVFSIVKKQVTVIEQVGVDEAYLDLSSCSSLKKAEARARNIRREIKKHTKLMCSIGIGPNKLVAKIASDFQKPDGLTIVAPADAEKFMEKLPLRAIPGIGPKAMARFARHGCYTVSDAKTLSWEALNDMFGKWGFGMYERLRGIDARSLHSEPVKRKSIGKHHTFMEDTLDMNEAFDRLRKQAQTILESMHKKKYSGFRTTVLTVRFDDFSTRTRSLTVSEPLSSFKALEAKALKLALPFFEKTENPKQKPIRLIGLRVESLE